MMFTDTITSTTGAATEWSPVDRVSPQADHSTSITATSAAAANRSPLKFPEKMTEDRRFPNFGEATVVDPTPIDIDATSDHIPHRPSDWPPLVALTTAAVEQQQQRQRQQREQQQQQQRPAQQHSLPPAQQQQQPSRVAHHHGLRLHPPPPLSGFPPRVLTAGAIVGQSYPAWSFEGLPVNDGLLTPPSPTDTATTAEPLSPTAATHSPTSPTSPTSKVPTYALPSAVQSERMKWAFLSLYQHLMALESVYEEKEKGRDEEQEQEQDGEHEAQGTTRRRTRTCQYFLEPLEWTQFPGELQKTLRSGGGGSGADYDRGLCLNSFLRKANAGLYQSLEQIENDVHRMCCQIQRITVHNSLAADDAKTIMRETTKLLSSGKRQAQQEIWWQEQKKTQEQACKKQQLQQQQQQLQQQLDSNQVRQRTDQLHAPPQPRPRVVTLPDLRRLEVDRALMKLAHQTKRPFGGEESDRQPVTQWLERQLLAPDLSSGRRSPSKKRRAVTVPPPDFVAAHEQYRYCSFCSVSTCAQQRQLRQIVFSPCSHLLACPTCASACQFCPKCGHQVTAMFRLQAGPPPA